MRKLSIVDQSASVTCWLVSKEEDGVEDSPGTVIESAGIWGRLKV